MRERQPAVFLDRDGVLNVDKGYVQRIEDLEWIPGAIEAVKLANAAGRLVIVVTNQSGIARGLYGENDARAFHAAMSKGLTRAGARIDAFYLCPHHPDGTVPEFARVCDCRKPAPGLILRALEEWPIDVARSFLIGDKESDLAAAAAAGVRGYLFAGDDLEKLARRAIEET